MHHFVHYSSFSRLFKVKLKKERKTKEQLLRRNSSTPKKSPAMIVINWLGENLEEAAFHYHLFQVPFAGTRSSSRHFGGGGGTSLKKEKPIYIYTLPI